MGPCLRRGLRRRGETLILPQSPPPRRRPGSPAVGARSQPQETPACAGDTGRRRLNPLNRAGRIWRPCSEMGPQTAGAVGGDARRRGSAITPSPKRSAASSNRNRPPSRPSSNGATRTGTGIMGSHSDQKSKHRKIRVDRAVRNIGLGVDFARAGIPLLVDREGSKSHDRC